MNIILLKSACEDAYSSGTDPYIKVHLLAGSYLRQVLQSHDISVELIETMSFTICGCLFERLCKWRSLYSCIVFCSRRAVYSFASTNLIGIFFFFYISSPKGLTEDLCFAVGPATSAAGAVYECINSPMYWFSSYNVRGILYWNSLLDVHPGHFWNDFLVLAKELGFDPKGSHTGNAENLVNFVLKNYYEEVSKKPVLFLTGAKRSPVLPNKFREAGKMNLLGSHLSLGLTVDELVVYNSVPNPAFGDQLSLALKVNPISHWIYRITETRKQPAIPGFFQPFRRWTSTACFDWISFSSGLDQGALILFYFVRL